MKHIKFLAVLAITLLCNSYLLAQKETTVEVTILNNTFTHVDVVNAYGNEAKTYASTDIKGDKFTMNLNLANDIYRFDFGNSNYLLFVATPGEKVQMTIDANDLQHIVSVAGSPTMSFVQSTSNLMLHKKAVLDSLNDALQANNEQKFWSKLAQNINQYKQTNDEVDNYILATFNDVDTLNNLFKANFSNGKIAGGNLDVFVTAANKTLKDMESNYRPFATYLENVDHYYDFKSGRVNSHPDYFKNLDQYINDVNGRHGTVQKAMGSYMEKVKALLTERDSLAFNNLMDKKSNKNAWALKVYNQLANEGLTIASQHNYYQLQATNDDDLANRIVLEPQQIVKEIVNGYQTTYNETDSYINSRVIDAIKENKKDIAVLMFVDMFPREQNAALHEEVVKALHETHPDHAIVKERWNFINSTGYKTTVGSLAPELAFPDPEGKIRKLSDLKGKVVLIDFWASWCGPCRRESPNVRNVYAKYHDKGFEVFSVSLDRDGASWKRAIQDDKLVWPNHVSDLKQWQSEAAAIYGVRSIPAMFLLDREGRIVAKDLRGEALERAVKQLIEQ